ncbi:MAG: Ig-like domain repeat protein [Clostridiales bacterium]|nr:Ig-like domain repeat protein [Clostridiales bacterium]
MTYDGNGGTGAPAAASYLMGTSVRVEGLGNMKKNGYAFGGWTIASGNLSDTVQPNNIFPMPAAAVRLTAVWNQKILSLVDSQTGTLIYGTADSATYGVTTENIASAAYPVTLINAPEGVTASNIAVNSSGSGVLTLNSSASTPAGTYSGITAKVDDAESEAFALTVAPKLITESMIAAIPAQTYTGEQLTPEPAVTNGAAPALEKGADFDYSYNSNTNVGQASVTVTGKGGNYTGAAAQTFEIQKPGTTVELAAEPEQDAVYGDTLALSVRVLGENGSIPRGFVRLWDDYQQIGGETVLSDGRAKIAMPALSAGGHNFAVAYINSDGNHKDYSSDGNGYSELNSYNVAKAPTAVALTAETEASAVYGSSVALTAVISGGMNPSSTVTFFDGETQIGETAAVADGRAEKEILGLSAGSHTFRAEYSGDGNHNGSQGTLYGFNIEKAAQAALTVENPSEITYGSPEFKLTASGGSGDGGVTFAAADNGVLSVAADGSVTILGAGSVWVTATKASDSNYNQASSVPLEIIVHPRDIARNEVIVEVAGDRTYTGEQLAPSIEVTDSSAAITVGDWAAEWGENVSVAGGGSVTIRGQGNYAGQKTQSFDIEKAAPGYTAPDNLRATVGRTLADVKLPEHFSWEDDTSTLVGDAGKRIFLAAYTPPDSENYNVVSGIEVIVTVIRPHYPQFGNESGSDATPEPSATDATPEPEPMPDESSTPDESTSPDEDPAPDESPSPKPPKSGGALDAFTDIPMDAWYYADVEWVVSKGLFYGTSGSTFSPNAPMTRAMMITVLARDAGIDANGGATWYEKALNWGVSTGLTDGTNPNSPITREQLATLLYRYAKSPSVGGNLAAFSDVSDYAKDAMAWAVATGLLVGRTTATLAPKDDATRAEVAAILHRFFEEAAPAA